MRLLNILFLTLAATSVATAHTLDGDATLVEELGHQVSSTHHLPLLALAVAAALVVLWARRRTSRRR